MELFVLHLGAFIIGLAKAGFGGGLGMVVTPLWVLVIAPREAIGIALPLLIVGDIATLWLYWKGWDWRNVFALFPGAAIGIFIGMQFMGFLPDNEFRLVIGILALVFGMGESISSPSASVGIRGMVGLLLIRRNSSRHRFVTMRASQERNEPPR